jgi:hypothetical protein
MITGKHSALKGFGLFFYALVTLLVLICTCNTSNAWGVVGIVNTIINFYVILRLFKYWSDNE